MVTRDLGHVGVVDEGLEHCGVVVEVGDVNMDGFEDITIGGVEALP